ncbi:2-hydroxyacid dehydrogenase [Nitrincola tapanii]|uniref:2-hydroxyacid dehydrogenase n=1 Tax=Nitrincola tapanii TaxID=1708751 RepID=A0A5A9W6H0_9GAMM|nr:2-hydroxyacid dehydrogenase [Nitrincola tapanii]KAA0875131.1 2-hydroxyacid dehydrogenase [Nitrincola tapanii]
MRAVFLDTLSLDDLDFSGLESVVEELVLYPNTQPNQVQSRIQGFDLVITNKVVIDAEAIQQADHLALICVVATGVNNIDLNAAQAQGVAVVNCQAYGTHSVAQHVFSLMLALHTRLLDYHQAVQQGRWNQAEQFCLLDYPIFELRGRVLGILGYGVLGAEVARLAEAFGMQVMIAQRPGTQQSEAGRVPLVELLPQIDVLSIHCPLNDATRNLLDAEMLARMKPGSFLINAARGGIVCEEALASVLRSGHLAGAATDVLSVEPPRQGNCLLDPTLPNLIVTPHSAWGSVEARQTILQQTQENILAFQQGAALRRIV